MTNAYSKDGYFCKLILFILFFTIGCKSGHEENSKKTAPRTNYTQELEQFYIGVKMIKCGNLILCELRYTDSVDSHMALILNDEEVNMYSLVFSLRELSVFKDSITYHDSTLSKSIYELLPRLKHEKMYSYEIINQNGKVLQGVNNCNLRYNLHLIETKSQYSSGSFTDVDLLENVHIYQNDKESVVKNRRLTDNLSCSWYQLLNLCFKIN